MNRAVFRRSAAWLLGAALLFASAHAALNPRARAVLLGSLPPGEIAADDARALRGPTLWVDARPAAEFSRGHVPGAVNLPEAEWESRIADVLQHWEPGRRVIVYCSESGCLASRHAAERLRREYQLDDVWVLHGGWGAWQALEKKEPR